jgi:hypothetical protein
VQIRHRQFQYLFKALSHGFMRRSIVLSLLLATASAAQEPVIVRPKEIDDVLTNPGIGFTTLQRFNGDALNEGTKWTEGYPIVYQPFHGKLEVMGQPMTTIAYFRVYWRFVEPEMGKYNWEMLDQALKTASERGQTLMLRVAPYGTAGKPDDVPDWYRALVGDESSKHLAAKWRTDPENPLYVEHWSQLIRQLGKRCDGNRNIELIDISIVGAWGEGEGTEKLSDRTMKALTDAYLESFPRTLLVAQETDRRTNQYILSKRPTVGWRGDCLGDLRCVNGAKWCHMYDEYPEHIVEYGIDQAWKKGPVALEACWVMEHWKEQGWDLKYIIDQSLKWHISSFNNKSSAVPEEWRPEVDEWLKKMGYRYVLRKFTYPPVVSPNGNLEFTSWWENKGVAPCYKKFPLVFRLKNGNLAKSFRTDADIRTWLPGDIVYNNSITIPSDMTPGQYDLEVGIVDPESGKPNLKLAIAGIDADGWYSLGSITVRQ